MNNLNEYTPLIHYPNSHLKNNNIDFNNTNNYMNNGLIPDAKDYINTEYALQNTNLNTNSRFCNKT